MAQILHKPTQKLERIRININDTKCLLEIKQALLTLLFVPQNQVKEKIIDELGSYLSSKFETPEYPLKVFIAYQDTQPVGIVSCQIDPYYRSYSRKCGTFGWLHAYSFEVCRLLIRQCELFVKENKVRKLRGNINFPKNLGGIGIQFQGFNQEMLYGVAYNHRDSQILEYLDALGYQRESEYTCVRVEQKTWEKGKKIDKDIEFRYFTLNELRIMADEICDLAKSSFFEILPDSSGRNRIYEFFEAFSQVPKTFSTLPDDFEASKLTHIPQFLEAWESCDLKKIEVWAPLAFDKRTGELAGALLGLPDLYQIWNGKHITRANVDTAMVKKDYYGKGIFSALNNLGQLTASIFGVDYFEGTAIWSNNTRAIDTIFPHCSPIRKHYIAQKRV